MAQPISNLAVGAKVRDTATTLYGTPIVFQVGDKNHSGYPANSVTLVTEKIIKIMAVDGKEANNADANRKDYGNNRYSLSNIGQWLNKEGTNWYQAMHGQDAPPNSTNVSYNPYDTLAGFLTSFSTQMKAALLNTTLTVARATVDGGGSETTTAKVFLLSKAEVGLGAENGINEGSLLALFNANNSSRIAYPTAEAVANSNYTGGSLTASRPWYYWLRSPYFSDSYHVRRVYSDGSEANYSGASSGLYGLRPALNLPSSILVSDTPDGSGVYTITWNQAPSTPPNITVPTTVLSGQNAAISWGASTDPEGNAITYKLECAINGGAYSQIYSGSVTSYSHPILATMNTVQYRVKAVDSNLAESGYQTSQSRTVIHNVSPGISGTDTDYGVISEPFPVSFIVSDPDAGDSVVVDIRIDSQTVQQIDPVILGQQYDFTMSLPQFYALPSGQHTLKIVATDNVGASTTRTYTFTRAVTSVDFKLAPIQTDAMAEKILVSIQAYAADSDILIRVCNNALDASPTWEAATKGLKHIFSNTTKTAANWAVGVWVTINPSTAYPQVFCNGVNGSYI